MSESPLDIEALYQKSLKSVPPAEDTASTWRPVGGLSTAYVKWQDAGQSIEGTWKGTVAGKFGPQGVITDDTNKYVFGLHTVLANRLRDVEPGTLVRIVYNGTDTSAKTGRTYKSFQVYTK